MVQILQVLKYRIVSGAVEVTGSSTDPSRACVRSAGFRWSPERRTGPGPLFALGFVCIPGAIVEFAQLADEAEARSNHRGTT